MPIYLRHTTYLRQNLPPTSLADLPQDVQDGDQSTAPLTRIQKGRRGKQRLPAGEARIRNSTCGTCGEARSCRRPHM